MAYGNMKVLFIVPYPTEGPSARLRVEQFLPSLDKAGIRYVLRPFYSTSFYRILYKKNNILKKIAYFMGATAGRVRDIFTAIGCDIIFIHREAFPVGLPVFEAVLFLLGKKVVFDYDDAIFLPPQGSGGIVRILKCPWKTGFIIKHSKLVIAGNDYLRKHAEALNDNVIIIPTCIDTGKYRRISGSKNDGGRIVIGWIGSHTTHIYLREVRDVLYRLLARYDNLRIDVVGGVPGDLDHDRIFVKEWSLDREMDEMSRFDIGIMPMPDTEWTRGKCAFKAILYMSMGIPVVASPVGVNKDIIIDGNNGYLAGTDDEWERKLASLIDDGQLRERMGNAGRETVVEKFSLAANSDRFVSALKEAFSR